MSDEGRTRLQEPSLDVIEHEDLAGLQLSVLEREDYVLRRLLEADPASARLSFGLGNDPQQTVRGDPRDPFNGIAVINYGPAPVAIAFGAGNAVGAPLFTAPPQSIVVYPGRFADISLGVDAATAQGAAFAVNVMRLRIAPLTPYMGSIPGASGGHLVTQSGPVDISDRKARQNGVVRQDQQWSAVHVPNANVQATVTRAAGGAGVAHVCTGILASLLTNTASSGTVELVLRDGASGVGNILMAVYLGVTAVVGQADRVALSGLQIPGSPNTLMTLEFTGASILESVTLIGYDA